MSFHLETAFVAGWIEDEQENEHEDDSTAH